MIAQLISNASTILVALIGFIAVLYTNAKSNRQALELEKLKHNQEKIDRYQERHRALLEELCSLCYQVEREIATALQIPEEIKNTPPLPVTISEPINRMSVIVNLYYRELKFTFDVYIQRLYELQNVYNQYYEKVKTGKASPEITRLALINQERKIDDYKGTMDALVDGIVELSQQQE